MREDGAHTHVGYVTTSDCAADPEMSGGISCSSVQLDSHLRHVLCLKGNGRASRGERWGEGDRQRQRQRDGKVIGW